MRYLVTGGAGFIGSHLVDALVARGDRVLILDDLSTGRSQNIAHVLGSPAVEFREGTILDERAVDECMATVDACFHLAAAVGVALIVDRPLDSLLRNVRGSDAVISSAVRHDRPLLYTSTSEIYGKCDAAVDEFSDRVLGSLTKSRWAYALAKSFGEVLAYGYAGELNARVVVARLFNAVGPRQTGAYGMVLPRFVRQATAGAPVTVFGTGEQTRCFTHVADTVRALTALMDTEASYGNVYNVGAAAETSIVNLARLVIARTGSGSEITFVPYEDAYREGFEDLGHRIPESGRLRALTGWRPERTIEDAIDDVVAHEAAVGRLGQALAG